jgi:purine-binding chemotaxis protein CheW
MNATNAVDGRAQYLSFGLAGGDYAIGILKVKEILQYEEITPVPSTPRSIRGVINLRGSVVPVVDLAVKFGLEATPVTKRTCILVFEVTIAGAEMVMGLVTDSVTEVIELGPEDIEAAPSFGTGVRVDYLVGMGKVGKGFVLLLDLEKVLSADEREFVRDAADAELVDPSEGHAPVSGEPAGPSASPP